jgi:Mn-dependent DtxR family transcriptional regulator
MPRTIKAKKRCCQSRPRCKRCPVVLRRLARAGLVEREGKRRYVLDDALTKKALRAARGR